MRFISNGDYIFPLHFPGYWAEHVYMWSYQHGAANPDGIMRLPGRLLDLLVFALFGNLAIGYFYAAFCMAMVFASFFWFARVFLETRRLGLQLLGALLFTCNPIFLGNMSKVGLVLAAAMLPLCLTALKQGFMCKRFSYFLLYVLGLNIALLHPFTFSVDLLVSGIYLIHLVRRQRVFVRDNWLKFGVIVLLGLLLNAYFLLPIGAMGSVDKGVLSDTVASAPTDYTRLVDVANTGDLFTALSLSKGVFKDYEFFGALTWPFYFLGVFGLYAIVLGTYIRVEKRTKPADRRRLVLALGLFLVLVVLATATYLHADLLIKFLIGLPGGWMFRSPLKWQLFMPLALGTALVTGLKYVRSSWQLRALYVATFAAILLMNGYLGVQIYKRLLTPRSIAYFSGLAAQPLDQKNMLFIGNDTCVTAARNNPAMATELNEVLMSKYVQVKHISTGLLDSVNVGRYDFVLGCRGSATPDVLAAQYDFVPVATYVGGLYELYRNTHAQGYATSTTAAVVAGKGDDHGDIYHFVTHTLRQSLPFTDEMSAGPSRLAVDDIFSNLAPSGMADGTLRAALAPQASSAPHIFVQPSSSPLYYHAQNQDLQFFTTPQPGARQVSGGELPLAGTHGLAQVSYHDPNFGYQNLVPNASFERGLWQKQVGDCNAYDDQPELSMRLSNQKTNGEHSLELQALQHIACTGPEAVRVKPAERYMVSFDYQSVGGQLAGYFVGFDDLNTTNQSERLPDTLGAWRTFTTEVAVPLGADSLKFMAYAFPATMPSSSGLARYDNVRLVKIPAVAGRFFAVQGQPPIAGAAPATTVVRRNPTKQLIRITHARAPFYLSTAESYAPQWQLALDNGQSRLSKLLPWKFKAIGARHLMLDSSFNGWYIDPRAVCAGLPSGCSRQSDGSFNLMLVMEFAPQRWFYTGALITAAGGLGATILVWSEWRTARKAGKK